MSKLLLKELVPLPVENRRIYGMEINHLEVGKLYLWLVVWLPQWIFADEPISWKYAKQYAKQGKLYFWRHAGACAWPLWTNVYYLKKNNLKAKALLE